MQRYGFFNAKAIESGYDRVYDSKDFSALFKTIFGEGVFEKEHLKVTAGEGLSVVVSPGWAFVDGLWYENTEELILEVHPHPDSSTVRYDSVKIRAEQLEDKRIISAVVDKGVTSVRRDTGAYELTLAIIRVEGGINQIYSEWINDMRADEFYCGIIGISERSGSEYLKTLKDVEIDNLELDEGNYLTYNLSKGRWVNTSEPTGKIAESITRLDNRFTGFSTAMSQGMELLFDRVDEADAKIKNNTEDIDALKIIPTASGNTAYIADASNMNLENIIFYGESKQMQTTGKNELDCNGLKEQASFGVTATPVFENGVLKYVNVNGTATERTYLSLGSVLLSDETEHILSGCPVGGGWNGYILYARQGKTGDDTGSGVKLVNTDNIPTTVTISIAAGYTANNLKFYPMIRLATIADATYEPYTGGKPAPNPDYPQPIESKIVNRVDVLGKNWLKFSQGSTTIEGVTFTVNANKSVTANGTATEDAVLLLTTSTRGEVDLKRLTGKNIILSGCPKGGSSSTYKFQFWSASKYAVDTGNGATLDLSTVPDSWNFAISIIKGTTVSNLTFKPMIRLASITDDTYEPYQSQTKILATGTYRLDGIGDLKNYYDAKRGVFGEKVDRVTFDGSDDEHWATYDTGSGKKRLYSNSVSAKSNVNNSTIPNILCSHYKPVTPTNTFYDVQGITISTGERPILYLYDETFNTGDISAWRAHLQANPMTVVYEVAEPEEGNLISSVKDDFAEFLKLHTYKPNTVVMNGADAEMDVSYVADAKTYIDKKFEALASAIVNH